MWHEFGDWRWANRYAAVNAFSAATQTDVVNALASLHTQVTWADAVVLGVGVSPVPDPGALGYVFYPINQPGEFTPSGGVICPPEACVWVSLNPVSGLRGRKSYRNAMGAANYTGNGRKPSYNAASAIVTSMAAAWTDLMESLDEANTTLRIGVGGVNPSGRVVASFTVRERPIAVKVNKVWYNVGPTPP